MVYVFDDFAALTGDAYARALALASPQRREAALRCRHEGGRRQSLAAFLLLRYGLRREYGVMEPPDFDVSAGKPKLPGMDGIFFNLSHCRCAAACALANTEIGVDVQDWAKLRWTVARRVLCAEELALLKRSSEPGKAFTLLWTRKESYGKMTGQGILYPMKAYHLGGNNAPPGTVLETVSFPEYALSYCGAARQTVCRVDAAALLLT